MRPKVSILEERKKSPSIERNSSRVVHYESFPGCFMNLAMFYDLMRLEIGRRNYSASSKAEHDRKSERSNSTDDR